MKSDRPYLRVLENNLGWTGVVVCGNPYLSLVAVEGIVQGMIDKEHQVVAISYDDGDDLPQSCMNKRVG